MNESGLCFSSSSLLFAVLMVNPGMDRWYLLQRPKKEGISVLEVGGLTFRSDSVLVLSISGSQGLMVCPRYSTVLEKKCFYIYGSFLELPVFDEEAKFFILLGCEDDWCSRLGVSWFNISSFELFGYLELALSSSLRSFQVLGLLGLGRSGDKFYGVLGHGYVT